MNRLLKLSHHLDDRIEQAKQLQLPKVRLEMVEIQTAEILLALLRRIVNAQTPRT